MKRQIIVLLMSFFLAAGSVSAVFSPNNKVGIHLAVPSDEDVQKASDLVNSTGGKWGYVTLVIQENDRNHDKWQGVFDKLRKKRLIPIIRIGTEPQGAMWKKPSEADAKGWAEFLSGLNWVTKDRYIILFNEPNHGQEWGGSVNPEDYASVSLAFAKELKHKSSDFFIMLAGLDAAAPSQVPAYEDEAVFLSKIIASKKEIFDQIDGWSSHSYPNPGFAGSPYDRGRNSIANYQWELSLLNSLGIEKELPVFITETGWPHSNFSPETVGQYLNAAYERVWNPDGRVRAVTPFVLNYQGEPFLQFSWQKKESTEMYDHYFLMQGMAKIEGSPEQIEKGKITLDLPKELLVDSTYTLPIRLENKGQALWDKDEGYQLKLEEGSIVDSFFSDIKEVAPFEDDEVYLYIKTGSKKAKNKVKISLYKGDRKVMDGGVWNYMTGPLPKLTFRVSRIPKLRKDNNQKYEIQVFDSKEQLVFKKKGIKTIKNVGVIEQVRNVYPAGRYRVVVLSDYYLPRQTFITIKKEGNEVTFKPLLPFDFNKDGKFDIVDFAALIRNFPLLRLFIP